MSTLAIVLLVISSSLGYTVGAGITYAVGKERGWDFDWPGPCFAVGLWPLTLPALLSASATQAFIASRKRKQLPRAKVVQR